MRTALCLLFGPALLAIGCCNLLDEDGCKKDTDCKGDRVCIEGQCAEPPPGGRPAPGLAPVPTRMDPTPAEVDPNPPQPRPTIRGLQPPPAVAACDGEETPCALGGGRWGWCKAGRCKNICPGTMSYSPLDTQCHPRCTASCQNCMDGHCMDVSAQVQP